MFYNPPLYFKTMKRFIIVSISILFLSACKKKDTEIAIYEETWGVTKPTHFPESVYDFENNTQTQSRFELGRFLFYDPILSLDSSVSCSSCHAQEHAFSDHNIKFSTGVNGNTGHRNAPSLSNLIWYSDFMWDGGVNHIEVQPLVPLTHHLEMGETIPNILLKLNNSAFYKTKFKEAYDVHEISDQKLLQAITQFVGMLTSYRTKYDDYINGQGSYTQKEKNGLSLFRANCVYCHREPLFTDFSFKNVGLDSLNEDIGRELITQNSADKGKFKVPSLRNVALTYPYMHDGRFFTLNDLLDNHTNNAVNHFLTDQYILGRPHFTNSEKEDIIAFLKTLSDYYLIGDPALSPPNR